MPYIGLAHPASEGGLSLAKSIDERSIVLQQACAHLL